MSRSASMRDKVRPARGFQQLTREKVRPTRPLQRHFREKVRPTRLKTAFFGRFGLAGRTFSRSRTPSGHAGRTFSRTGHSHVATMQPMTPLQPLMQASVKPPSPLLAPEQQALKPATPLQPKNALKTPISHPQRRWRFQTTGPAGLQGLAVAPMSGGGAWPGDQLTADVTNVVKPTRFQSPRENPCYKRRQSKPKNRHYQRKSPRIDDVRNNGAEIHTKNTLD